MPARTPPFSRRETEMPDLPDVFCWIKFINQTTGKEVPSGSLIDQFTSTGVTVRYVVANDSNKPTGQFVVVGSLQKDGVKLSNPVPAAWIQLQPKEIWKHEHPISFDNATYVAKILGDVGNFHTEETENNNMAEAWFGFHKVAT
jgi:hypothetical protein